MCYCLLQILEICLLQKISILFSLETFTCIFDDRNCCKLHQFTDKWLPRTYYSIFSQTVSNGLSFETE